MLSLDSESDARYWVRVPLTLKPLGGASIRSLLRALLCFLLAGCGATTISDAAVEYYKDIVESHDGPAAFRRRLPAPPPGRGYIKVFRGGDGRVNQVVMYGEPQGHVFAWFMQKYFYQNGDLKYLAEYSNVCGNEWTLKGVLDIASGEWLQSINSFGLAQEFDQRDYPATHPD